MSLRQDYLWAHPTLHKVYVQTQPHVWGTCIFSRSANWTPLEAPWPSPNPLRGLGKEFVPTGPGHTWFLPGKGRGGEESYFWRWPLQIFGFRQDGGLMSQHFKGAKEYFLWTREVSHLGGWVNVSLSLALSNKVLKEWRTRSQVLELIPE